jgi:hypothetical protein
MADSILTGGISDWFWPVREAAWAFLFAHGIAQGNISICRSVAPSH